MASARDWLRSTGHTYRADTPRDETERDADFEQGERRQH